MTQEEVWAHPGARVRLYTPRCCAMCDHGPRSLNEANIKQGRFVYCSKHDMWNEMFVFCDDFKSEIRYYPYPKYLARLFINWG